ncbi:MAG: T9SS type A sorting domain-containing protein, partial [Bacteroidota bacterium]|nr:T9SS type A sorting domain-containing protein [Bacteroidota bacterium]
IISSHAYGNGNDKITWHKNFGNGNFSSENIINDTLVIPRYFFPADFDNDNDLDMVMTSWNMDSLVWQENLGNGNFGPMQLISNTIDGPYGVYAGDLDGDGYMDIVAGAEKACAIEVYINRGTGSFDLNQTIAYAAVRSRSVYVADLDNDGHKDILSASRGDNKVAWYKNLGNKKFSLQKVISDSVINAWSVYAADFDNDGFGDVIASGWGDAITWYRNMQNDSFDAPYYIQGTFGNSTLCMAKDLDGDSLIDIVGGVSGNIRWAKNLGNGNFGPSQFICSMTVLNTFDINDINGDGYLDIVYADGTAISAVINNGTGSFLPVPNISQINGARDLQLTDLDGDGYNDVLYVDYDNITSNNLVGWYKNDGLGNFTTSIFISYIESSSYTIVATDIDNDGDKDIFTAPRVSSNNSGKLVWFENLGSGNFGQLQNVDYTGGKIWDIHISDIDNDNDNDIVLALSLYSTVKWLENTLNNLIDTVFICADDSALIFSSWVSLPGYYYDTLQNVLGGDSINIISLEHYQTYFPVDTVEICEGETYSFYGQTLDSAGIYFATFQSVQGCDSIVELPLQVIPAPAVSISSFVPDSVAIDTGLLALPAATPSGGIYTGTGVVANSFDPALAGLGEFWVNYTFADTITACTGKDSTLIKVYDPIGIEELKNSKVKLYPNPGTGDFILTGTNLKSVQVKTLSGKLIKEVAIKDRSEVHFNLTEQAKGIYFVHIVNEDAQIRRLLILM